MSGPEGACADTADAERMELQIYPRRKAGQKKRDVGSTGKAVMVSLKVLEEFADIPLVHAAKSLGISKTALKSACRALGLDRWPFRRLTDAPSAEPAPKKPERRQAGKRRPCEQAAAVRATKRKRGSRKATREADGQADEGVGVVEEGHEQDRVALDDVAEPYLGFESDSHSNQGWESQSGTEECEGGGSLSGADTMRRGSSDKTSGDELGSTHSMSGSPVHRRTAEDADDLSWMAGEMELFESDALDAMPMRPLIIKPPANEPSFHRHHDDVRDQIATQPQPQQLLSAPATSKCMPVVLLTQDEDEDHKYYPDDARVDTMSLPDFHVHHAHEDHASLFTPAHLRHSSHSLSQPAGRLPPRRPPPHMNHASCWGEYYGSRRKPLALSWGPDYHHAVNLMGMRPQLSYPPEQSRLYSAWAAASAGFTASSDAAASGGVSGTAKHYASSTHLASAKAAHQLHLKAAMERQRTLRGMAFEPAWANPFLPPPPPPGPPRPPRHGCDDTPAVTGAGPSR